MPIRVQTKAMMEEDFPRGIPFVSSIEDLNANSTEVEIKRPSSIKTKRKNKIRQLLDGQTGVNKEDLLAEDKDELKKIREEEATENGDELFKVSFVQRNSFQINSQVIIKCLPSLYLIFRCRKRSHRRRRRKSRVKSL